MISHPFSSQVSRQMREICGRSDELCAETGGCALRWAAQVVFCWGKDADLTIINTDFMGYSWFIMYTYIYIYVCVYIYIYMCVCVCVHIYTLKYGRLNEYTTNIGTGGRGWFTGWRMPKIRGLSKRGYRNVWPLKNWVWVWFWTALKPWYFGVVHYFQTHIVT